MGGLVAAMYATGMSPAEMLLFVNRIDWDAVLSNPPRFEDLSYRRKEEQRAYPGTIELGARRGLQLPADINTGHNIGLIFDRLTLSYSSVKSFDELPIPFRCVATDMVEARPVILKSGSLSQALRATMSIPGIFTPVEMDGMVLADGGLMNNIPTDVAREMGADIIIAVNVGTPLGKREDIATLPGMLNQVIGVATIEGDRRNLKLADLIITPELGKFTSIDFKAGNEIADLGYQSTIKKSRELKAYSLDEEDWKAHLAARQARRRTTIPTPMTLEVLGTKRENAEVISQNLKGNLGQRLDTEELGSGLSEIRGGGRYESLGYGVVQKANETSLQIRVRDKTTGPPLLTPIVQFQSSDASDVELSLGARLTMFDVGGYGSELRTYAIVGSSALFGMEYYRPVGRKGFFLAPRAYFAANSVSLFADGDRVAEYRQRRFGAGFDAGYIFNRRSQLRVGYEVARAKARVTVGDPILPTVKGLISDASARFVFDGQDSAMVPTRGVRISSEAHWFLDASGAARSFPQAEVRASLVRPVSDRGSLFVYGGGGTSFKQTAAPLQEFTLGGPFRLGAYGREEFRGINYVLGSGGYLQRIGFLPEFLGGKIYGVGWYESGSVINRSADANYRSSLSGAIIMETRLGPIIIGGALGEGGRQRFFISMGKVFYSAVHLNATEAQA
jgi:NTE family protein